MFDIVIYNNTVQFLSADVHNNSKHLQQFSVVINVFSWKLIPNISQQPADIFCHHAAEWKPPIVNLPRYVCTWIEYLECVRVTEGNSHVLHSWYITSRYWQIQTINFLWGSYSHYLQCCLVIGSLSINYVTSCWQGHTLHDPSQGNNQTNLVFKLTLVMRALQVLREMISERQRIPWANFAFQSRIVWIRYNLFTTASLLSLKSDWSYVCHIFSVWHQSAAS